MALIDQEFIEFGPAFKPLDSQGIVTMVSAVRPIPVLTAISPFTSGPVRSARNLFGPAMTWSWEVLSLL
ncbi:MAG: hypothetical protein QOH05_1511 [Acetobacteraceae bacterium]|jgi:hypothetical protein|nr:hypothetical protein [Acetobacteraceae bacterium]